VERSVLGQRPRHDDDPPGAGHLRGMPGAPGRAHRASPHPRGPLPRRHRRTAGAVARHPRPGGRRDARTAARSAHDGQPRHRARHAPPGDQAGRSLDANPARRRAPSSPRVPGAAVQVCHRLAAHGVPGAAARRACREPSPALRRLGGRHRPGRRLARPELLRTPLPGSLRTDGHYVSQALCDQRWPHRAFVTRPAGAWL
jgi:hypothetical protein